MATYLGCLSQVLAQVGAPTGQPVQVLLPWVRAELLESVAATDHGLEQDAPPRPVSLPPETVLAMFKELNLYREIAHIGDTRAQLLFAALDRSGDSFVDEAEFLRSVVTAQAAVRTAIEARAASGPISAGVAFSATDTTYRRGPTSSAA